jgi:hypothetical protein
MLDFTRLRQYEIALPGPFRPVGRWLKLPEIDWLNRVKSSRTVRNRDA